MGHYIKQNSKGEALPSDYDEKILELCYDGAEIIDQPKVFEVNLVVVANNGNFSVVAYCYDEAEFRRMTYKDDRPITWLRWPHAATLKKENTKD